MTEPRALVIVPTYNERENLPLLTDQLMQHPNVRLLVVDDQSPDGTGEVADALARRYAGRVEVMHRTGPRGLGRSYLDGFRKAVIENVDVVCQMDADFSHDPAELPTLIAGVSDADLVLGSRYVPGGGVVNWPLRRRAAQPFRQRLHPDGHAPRACAIAPPGIAAGGATRSARCRSIASGPKATPF